MKQVKILDVVNDKLEQLVKQRKKTQLSANKQSVTNELIIAAHKKECK
ncbi:MAG: hypothetical protein HRU18_23510 [Pseudoalteromonas sp.]|nr:hypothetical protein [Pseudoalteromonas sp.]NRA81178.1 hypothetical protein [Pseudoalteromonas sp.]